MNYNKYKWAIISAASVIAGIINGLIGTGGGIILYFALKLQAKLNKNNDDAIKDIMANIIAVVVPMSIVSSVAYMIRDEIKYAELVPYLSAAVAGGLVGALLLNKIKPKIIRKIFALMIIYAGVQMMFK